MSHQKNQMEEKTGYDSRSLKKHMMYLELQIFLVSKEQEAYVSLQMMMHHLYITDLQIGVLITE